MIGPAYLTSKREMVNGILPYRRITDRLHIRGFRSRKRDFHLVTRINARASQMLRWSDRELKAVAEDLRDRVQSGASLLEEAIVVPAFALVKEAARRTLGMQHFDEQLLAGIALASSAIAEMQTGEGKTLASTLPAFLHALTGKGVHVATVNVYLASRDFRQMSPLFELLGLTVGYARDGDDCQHKRAAYACDITYVTGYELGFDYLRDRVLLSHSAHQPVGARIRSGLRADAPSACATSQRGHAFAIIDEVDSVLIDEATTPLVLSAAAGSAELVDTGTLKLARRLALGLREGTDFVFDTHRLRLTLSETGAGKVHASFPRDQHGLVRPWTQYAENALQAEHQFQRDVHYVVCDDKVQIVDEYTGRIFSDRTWRRGLHQAIEVKERIPITAETRPVASISRQRFFQLYDRLCGMTGTATSHEAELFSFYRLPVVQIPLRRLCQRTQAPTRYFADAEAKWNSIAQQVKDRYDHGQPVLVGTRSIADSRRVASQLVPLSVPFRLLNGVQDEDEAAVIATAGEAKTVTIATNMAGRGTDIKPTAEARQAGGLHVIACERHESRRIDRQLIGRAARQGEPGSCQFFVAADDSLVRRYGLASAKAVRQAGARRLKAGQLDDAVRRMQIRAEHHSYEQRQQLMNYELWLEQIRASVA